MERKINHQSDQLERESGWFDCKEPSMDEERKESTEKGISHAVI